MNCEEIRNLALLAACGEASPSEAEGVRQHAAACAACAAEIRALNDGLELLKHAPRETPSLRTQEAIGAMLLREAPVGVAPAVRFWAAAAVALVALSAGLLAWKLGVWQSAPAPIARKDNPVVQPQPAPPVKGPEPVKPKPAADKALAWVPPAAADKPTAWTTTSLDGVESLASAVTELRGSGLTLSRPDPKAVWFGQSITTTDSMYDSLDELATSPDRF